MNSFTQKRAAVIGHPLLHTLSPKLHMHWLDRYKIDGVYEACPIDPATLRDDVLRLRDKGFVGLNVTVPHKENVMSLCDSLTADAQKIGAVNTILFHSSGVIEGHNHDAHGFIAHARACVPDLDLSRVMVLGAGGAARAILYALKQAGAGEIFISNRTLDRAENLADEFGTRVVEWETKENYLSDVTLLINTTSAGMAGQADLEIDVANLPTNAVVYDIVYKPLITPLLAAAQAKNLRIITGLGMLIHQAAPAFKQFFGVMPTINDDELERLLLS